MSGRALIVHATNLLVRAFESTAADRVSESGAPTNALFSSVRAVRRAVAFKEPTVAVAVTDSTADPAHWPKALKQQRERLGGLLEAHGIPVVSAPEPASLVATYVQSALSLGHDVVVVGRDKRLAQLVHDRVWWYDPYKDVRYTPALVRKRFEVGPDAVAGWLALVGDDDALPGIKGIGKKGARGLVEAFGSVSAAIEAADAVEGRSGKALRASLSEARRAVERATLDRARPLPVPLERLRYSAPEPAVLERLYGQLGFVELLSASAGGGGLEVSVCSTPAELTAALGRFDERPIALHAVTSDPSPARGSMVGLALAQAGGPAFYAPWPHMQEALRALLEDPARAKIGHDIKAARLALARCGVTLSGIIGDSACASHLHEPSNYAPHDLTIVTKHVLRRALPEAEAVRGTGRSRKDWDVLPVSKVADFAGCVAEASASVWQALSATTDATQLAEYLALGETLVGMERRGIACDAEDLATAGADFTRIGAELEAEVHTLAGRSFNLGSTKQLGTVLFAELELPVVKRTKTGWSTATHALERIEHAHPIVPLVIRWRRLRRLRDTWVTALSAAIDTDGRVRSTFHPARSFSGRLVNSHPDLGRVPGRTQEMQRIRHAFRAPRGKTLLSVDYNQLGLYVLAHLSQDPALVEPLMAGADMHTLTAAAVLERTAESIDVASRQIGKLVNFATFAGQGASALAMQLGQTAAEAKVLIARFDERYAVTRAFQEEQLRLAQERGFVQTIAGRRWPIADLRSRDMMGRSYAERLARRATHEGSVADVSRRGLLHADQALRARGLGAFPLLQVHDEVLFEVPDAELHDAARVIVDAMRNAYALTVPLRLGCKAGPSWAELERLELAEDSVVQER